MSQNKSNIEDLLEDYATSPVPEGIAVGGLRISMINTALTFSLPGLVTGVAIGTSLGLIDALIAFVAGGLILALFGFITGLVGVRNRLSSYMLIRLSFGEKGSQLVNICIAFSMFGWFGVNVYLFGDAGAGLWALFAEQALPSWIFVLLGGVLMTAAAIVGFKSIQKLSAVVVPLQIIIFSVLVFNTLSHVDLGELVARPIVANMSMGAAISAVVGSFMVAALVMPDFTRYGKTTADAAMASFIPYLFMATIVYVGSALAALWLLETDILKLLVAAGLGSMAFIFILFSSTITNAVNLYGCSLSLAAVFPKLKEWHITLASGVLGTIVAFAGILEHFIDFIFSLGVIFSPVAAIYVADFFLVNRGHYAQRHCDSVPAISWPAISAWLLGILVAFVSSEGAIRLTTIPACDSFLSAVIIYVLLMAFKKHCRTVAA
ncbi:cytosine permease [Dasania sp. GY-MA-18]|uniref:Cytosine permease n=1 Tax=Dasania phycosphaerae TaxID=2950436 RepID=A0A9J6RQM4_9GAMM|nr:MULTISPECIES: cytosine permease [Dasania]MCR8924222.1 cytosine permease [Dasania sp. GY-MA-18]MCZ0866875.1 cytosine permease [Dasania phycosphaerae]MCZ0870379.1 cytosine permease [Dasania phycosphaerae]